MNRQHPIKTLKSKSKVLLVPAAGLVLTAVGGFGLWQRYNATHKKAALPAPGEVVTHVVTEPSEAKPADTQAYNVPADQPKKIILKTINTSGYIQRVGVDKAGAIGSPSNVYFAGWYTQSVAPAKEGLSIIDGHVSGKYSDGIFKNLGKLLVGDTLQVQYGNGDLKSFMVVAKRQVPEAEAAEALLQKHNDITAQLNLMTCAGKFNKTTNRYDDRLLVVTKAI